MRETHRRLIYKHADGRHKRESDDRKYRDDDSLRLCHNLILFIFPHSLFILYRFDLSTNSGNASLSASLHLSSFILHLSSFIFHSLYLVSHISSHPLT
ncbi:MAG: hypothetical protein HUU12_05095 [Anaerolineales bacterium]|nr:hypothetical protein [Anaerolineales bacterium]